jgi:hypothetical protein
MGNNGSKKVILLRQIDTIESGCRGDNLKFINKLNKVQLLEANALVLHNENKKYYIKTLMNGENFGVDTIELIEEGPGYLMINNFLSDYHNRDRLEASIFRCRESALSVFVDGSANIRLEPSFWTEKWLQIDIDKFYSCGGVRDSGSTGSRIFDVSSGEEHNMVSWFKLKQEPFIKNHDSMAFDEGLLSKISSLARQAFDDEEHYKDCMKDSSHMSNLLGIKLSYNGLIFRSSGACTACRACGFDAVVPYDLLYPYLNDEGVNHILSIKQSAQPPLSR